MKNKNKKIEWVNKLQTFYLEGKITSYEAFREITNFIKGGLMDHLINKGYYIHGVRQTNFSEDLTIDCYVYVMEHILGTFVKNSGKRSAVKYDPSRSNIVTFMNYWVRGFCGLILSKQKKEHKYGANILYSLEDVLVNYESSNFIDDSPYLYDEDNMDRDKFLDSSTLSYYDSKDLDDLDVHYIEREVDRIFDRV